MPAPMQGARVESCIHEPSRNSSEVEDAERRSGELLAELLERSKLV